jgi:DNA-binding MurR/RpiR family transcriptional regulator
MRTVLLFGTNIHSNVKAKLRRRGVVARVAAPVLEEDGLSELLTGAAPAASFDSLRALIHRDFDRLSPHLQRLARLALEDPSGFALATVAELARRTEVQPSSVIRFAKALGYAGFSDLQRVFKLRLVEGAPDHRARIHDRSARRGGARDGLAPLDAAIRANQAALDALRRDVEGETFRAAVALLAAARGIHVIGLRRAFPVAAYLFYGLLRSEFRCQLLDGVGGMVPQQAAAMGREDLLVAVSFAEYAPLTVATVQDAFIRGVPTLTVTDSPLSPLARHATRAFVLGDAATQRLRPLAAPLCLAQALIEAASAARRVAAPPSERASG